jgi:hypothetical protein
MVFVSDCDKRNSAANAGLPVTVDVGFAAGLFRVEPSHDTPGEALLPAIGCAYGWNVTLHHDLNITVMLGQRGLCCCSLCVSQAAVLAIKTLQAPLAS